MSWPRVFGPAGSSRRERRHALQRNGPHLRVILSNPFDASKFREVDAIIDSGASCVCISRRLVKDLGLEWTGPTRMIAVGAEHPAGMYACSIAVPELDFEKFLPVCAPEGVYTAPTILLGRSFLEFFVFSYQGQDGTFTFHSEATEPPIDEGFEEG